MCVGHHSEGPGLRSLLDRVNKGMVSEVVAMHRDGLARFATDLLEFFLRQQGCKLMVHRLDEGSSGHEVAEVHMEYIAVSVVNHNGERAAESIGKLSSRERQEEEEACALKGQEDVQPTAGEKGTRLPSEV